MTRLFRASLSAVLVAVAATMAIAGPVAASESGMPGPNDDITDVTGVEVGQVTNAKAHTGTTVVLMPNTATAGVDVRGGAAITRETDLLKPTNEVNKLNAVMLTGGGEYGLAAGPGVMQWLYDNAQGYQVGVTPDQVVPIVPGAAIDDLQPGRNWKVRPTFKDGYDAAAAASVSPVQQGNVGAGAGAVAGGVKGGVGSASVEVAPGVVVGALVVVDSDGTPVDTSRKCGLIGARYGLSGEFPKTVEKGTGCGKYRAPRPATGPANRGSVIGVVATNVTLDKAMNQKVAEIAHDGVTRALGRAHDMSSGDTMFAVSTDTASPGVGALPDCIHAAARDTALGCQLAYQAILSASSEAVARAVAKAVYAAKSVRGLAPSYCDTFPKACGTTHSAAIADVGAATPAPHDTAPVAGTGGSGGSGDPGVVTILVIIGVVGGAFALGFVLPFPHLRLPRRARQVGGALAAIAVVAVVGPLAEAKSRAVPRPDDPRCASSPACLRLVDRIGEATKTTMARAIAHAVVSAKSSNGVSSYCATFSGTCTGRNGYPNRRGRTGQFNNITDVPGIRVGAYTDVKSKTMGTTVVYVPHGAWAGVEVRGSAPGGRGTDAERADAAVQKVNSVVLTGGSAYGLAAGDGVARWLEKHHKGTVVNAKAGIRMPTVPTSVIFDLGRFGRAWTVHARPSWGRKAIAAARRGALPMGNVGAGAGAEVSSLKGGVGYASQKLGHGIVVGALVDTNAFGAPADTGNGCRVLGAEYQIGHEFGGLHSPGGCGSYTGSPVVAASGKNTTIGVVATNVPLSRPLLSKMAQFGQDGLAAALRPSHTYFDGDTVWALSTGKHRTSAGPTGTSLVSASMPLPGSDAKVPVAVLAFLLAPVALGRWQRQRHRRAAP